MTFVNVLCGNRETVVVIYVLCVLMCVSQAGEKRTGGGQLKSTKGSHKVVRSVTENGRRPLALPECKRGRRNTTTTWLCWCCFKLPEVDSDDPMEGPSFSGGAAGVVIQYHRRGRQVW